MYEIRLKLAIGILILSATTQCEEYKVTDRVYFDVQHGDKYVGRIVIGLFGEIAPKTVLNFKTLATNGIDGRSYKGTIFHRVIQRFMIQGGEIGGPLNSPRSIFGEVFEDENFTVKHNSPGMVSMANKGPNTNGCQFFITTVATSWLDGVHTVFGKVLQGQDVVHIIEHVKTDSDDVPLEPVKIVKSGVFKSAKNIYVTDETFTYSLMQWLRAGIVPLSFSFSILAFFHWAIRKLDGLT